VVPPSGRELGEAVNEFTVNGMDPPPVTARVDFCVTSVVRELIAETVSVPLNHPEEAALKRVELEVPEVGETEPRDPGVRVHW
jgi:hypothetical protein